MLRRFSDTTKRKLSLLQLAEELGNVSKACQLMGYHHDSFYEIRRAFQVGGVAALVEQRRGPKEPHLNRVAPEIEQRILDYALEEPTHGAQRVSNSCGSRDSTSAPPMLASRALANEPVARWGDEEVLRRQFALLSLD